jgi:triacylglycerol esterase/lipase EstA (alpha/beta hydrolase family)
VTPLNPGYNGGMRMRRVAATLAIVAGLAFASAGPASARDFAPVDRPGPPLSVPAAQLAAAFACNGDLAGAAATPVLLVPGTTLKPDSNFSWNYGRAFDARGIPWCTIELPEAATADIQVAGEYVVYAIRQMHDLSGRKISILGFSQGGMVPRWAFRFWPDTRPMVDDDIGLDASNHGTLNSEYCNVTRRCPAAFWQQRASANFIRALNSFQETFAGVSYTEIYSRADEVVTPNFDDSGSSSLRTGDGQISNVRVQDICPANTSDHLAMGSYDAVGYAVALDALTHTGPADESRIDRTVCTQPFQPGVNPATFPTDYAAYLAAAGDGARRARQVSAEPPLACYVYADCSF